MIIEARKAIKAALSATTTSYGVYYGQAEENASFPYAIFTLDVVERIDLVDRCELEINVVDYSRNTATAETICEEIIAALDHKTINTNDVSFTSYFELQNIVTAEDRKIVRRRLLFYFDLYRR